MTYPIYTKKTCSDHYVNGIFIFALIIFLTGTAAGETNRTGLIAEYHFDGNANDSSGNRNNGFVNGAAYIDGKIGNALSFDGENDFVRVPDSISLNPTSITIEAWVSVNGSRSSWHSILTKMDKVQDSGYELYMVQQNIPRFGLVSRGAKTVVDGNFIPLNKWTYLSATYDKSALILYVNGEIDSFTDKRGFLGTASSEDLYIGKWRDVDYFSGAIDEVHIYNRALSYEEIKENFRAALNPVTMSPAPAISTETAIQPVISPEITTNPDASNTFTPAMSFTDVPELTQTPAPPVTGKSPGFSFVFVAMTLLFSALLMRRKD